MKEITKEKVLFKYIKRGIQVLMAKHYYYKKWGLSPKEGSKCCYCPLSPSKSLSLSGVLLIPLLSNWSSEQT